MTGHRISLKGFRIKDGKLERVPGYGMNASQKIKQRTSKRMRPVKRKP
jgi:hypothetical protein